MEKYLQENIVGSYRGIRRLLGKRFKDNFMRYNRTIFVIYDNFGAHSHSH